jgi:photosystem II stability/assembly factor-like uncharacterized protein
MDPENNSTIYSTTDHGVFKTTNSGASWTSASNGLPDGVIALIVDPYDSTTLYALTGDNRLFKTSDGAATWSEVQTGVHDGNSDGVALATGSGRPGTVYLVYFNHVTGQGSIATSTDGGVTWSSVQVPSKTLIRSLTIDPSSPSIIYATSISIQSSGPPRGGILKTTNGGRNWESANGLPQNATINSFAIDPAAPFTLYAAYTFQAGGGGGILKSTDGGVSFGPIGTDVIPSLSQPTLAIDPTTSTVYVAYNGQTGSGILKSGDGGNSWEEADNGVALVDVSSMVVDPVNSATVYSVAPLGPVNVPPFYSGDGLYRSIDGASSWAGLAVFPFRSCCGASGLSQINSILVDYFNPSTLYALAGWKYGCSYVDNRLFKSTDNGATWSDGVSPPGSGCKFVTSFGPIFMVMDPTDPNRLYLGEYTDGEHGLTTSANGGATWRDVFTFANDDADEGDGNYTMAIDPTNSRILYRGLEDWNQGGVRKSVDGGATWIGSGLTGAAVPVMAIAPDGSAIYASTAGVYSHPAGFRGLFKSTDGGASWNELSQGLETLRNARIRVTAILTAPSNSDTVYLGTAGAGVFRSTDGGTTWSQFNDGLGNLNVRVLAMSRNGSGVLYAGTAGGVFANTLTFLPAPVVTGLRFDRPTVATGSSYSASFSGDNLTDETFFDVRYTAPGSNASGVVANWQKGLAANHSVSAGIAPGIWTINGVWAHQIETDHSGSFVPVAATITVSQ